MLGFKLLGDRFIRLNISINRLPVSMVKNLSNLVDGLIYIA